MDSKLIGGILLIVGQAIGGGMLALPIAVSQTTFLDSSLLLLGCWLVMTLGAFLILEINLWLSANNNFISMTKETLGLSGQTIAWFTYLLLLYSLMAAYIAGGSDFLKSLLHLIGLNLSQWTSALLFTAIIAYIVYLGIRSVDYANRGLMVTKFGTLILLIILISPHINLANLRDGNLRYITAGVTVSLTSFGFANIIPSLRTYFHGDVFKLRKVILIGSLIPLICYLCWDFVIMGVIPREGNAGLIAMLHSGRSTSHFVNELSRILHIETITVLARIFTSICLATSFLGVALSMSDFLADGLQLEKKGKSNFIIYGATFLPAFVIVLFFPGIFIKALSLAGIYCAILFVILPAAMAWQGRYHRHFSSDYRVRGGKILLVIMMMIGAGVIVQGIIGIFINPFNSF
jgi:tyrosine-specific transport protein